MWNIKLLKRLLSKVKKQIDKLTGAKPEEKKQKDGKKSWEKRKSELMEKTRKKDSTGKPYSSKPRPPKNKKYENKPSGEREPDSLSSDEKRRQPKSSQDRPRRSREDSSETQAPKPYSSKPRRRTEQVNQPRTERKPRPRIDHKPQEETTPWDISRFWVEPEEGKKRFHDLKIPLELMHAIADLNFKYCTPIQAQILEKALEGKDATGKAQTGTGKTAAFLITAITHLVNNPPSEDPQPGVPRALIIAPTRELVIQIETDSLLLSKYTDLRTIAVFGGMDYRKQKSKLSKDRVDILVATPGRLLDFKSKGDIKLNKVEILVIDEADRMLDMGFIPDVKKIVRSTPPKEQRQTLLLSATLSENVVRLASSWTKDSFGVEIDPEHIAVESVEQKVFLVSSREKYKLLHTILEKEALQRVIIFANRRDETKLLEKNLSRDGISCKLLSGDVDQRQRLRTLDEFKEGKIRVLVATDVASRGLHIDGVSHVINFTLPEDAEDYVHRIGRTGRAGNTGISISFASEDDSFQIPAIEKFIGRKLICIYPEDEILSSWEVEKKEITPEAKDADSEETNDSENAKKKLPAENINDEILP